MPAPTVSARMEGVADRMRLRPVDLAADRDLLLQAHCEVNFACDPAWARRGGRAAYRSRWLASDQPEAFLAGLRRSLDDRRTLAEIVEDPPGAPAAYLWVVFTDVEGHAVTLAEINDLWVAAAQRRHGIGRYLLGYIADEARRRGAYRLRSGTGAHNVPSLRMHQAFGFRPYRREYELLL